LCLPRFDSPSIFGRPLDDAAGHWMIRAAADAQITHRYLERTMVLETTAVTPLGTVVITDALAMGDGNRGHDLGQGAPHVLLRRDVHRGRGRPGPRLRAAARVRPRPSPAQRRPRWTDGLWWQRCSRPVLSHVPDRRSIVGFRPAPPSPRRKRRLCSASQQTGRAGHGPRVGPGRNRVTPRRFDLGVAVMVGASPGLRRSRAGLGPPQRMGAPGTVVRTDWRDLRRSDHVATRGGRRQQKLGLPLRLGPRYLIHPSRPYGSRPARTRPISPSTT
jgi:hypothetical protein